MTKKPPMKSRISIRMSQSSLKALRKYMDAVNEKMPLELTRTMFIELATFMLANSSPDQFQSNFKKYWKD